MCMAYPADLIENIIGRSCAINNTRIMRKNPLKYLFFNCCDKTVPMTRNLSYKKFIALMVTWWSLILSPEEATL